MHMRHIKNKGFLILLILGISIGFAFLAVDMGLFGRLTVKGKPPLNIYFDEIKVEETDVDYTGPEISENGKSLNFGVHFKEVGDEFTFTVKRVNGSDKDAMVSNISTKILEGNEEVNLSDYIEYSITYENGENIEEKDLLKSGDNISYKIHVKYINQYDKNTDDGFNFQANIDYIVADDTAFDIKNGPVLSKSKFKSFGNSNNPKQIKFLSTGISNPEDEKYTDISEEEDKSILAWMDGETMNISPNKARLYVKAPEDSSYLIGYSSSSDQWVQNLEKMYLSKLDTSNVTNMRKLFSSAGGETTIFEIEGLSNWNTGNVINMEEMFGCAGYEATTFKLDLSDWDISNVKDIGWMFSSAGYNAETFELNLSDWDTKNITDMNNLFFRAGQNSSTWSVYGLSNWNVGKIDNTMRMFAFAGYQATTFEVDLSGWDTSSVTNMWRMFWCTGDNAATFSIGDISGWDTSSVTDMEEMFLGAGGNATTFVIGNISGWDTSSVTNMNGMFSMAGTNAEYFLDLTGWDVKKVKYYDAFNYGVTSKVISPNWVN